MANAKSKIIRLYLRPQEVLSISRPSGMRNLGDEVVAEMKRRLNQ